MRRLISLFLVSCMMLVLIGSSKVISYADGNIDFSEPLLIKFSKDINEQNIYNDIKLNDEKNNEIPILINLKSKNEVVIIPLYDLSEVKVNIKTSLGSYELSKYMGDLFLNTEENLKRITQIQGSYYRGAVPEMSVADEASKGAGNSSDMGAGMSSTNVQVEGVDESDIVKTDGEYIYYLKDNQVVIVSAAKGDMKLMSTIGYLHEVLYPTELYIDKDILVVLGNSYGPKGSFAKAVIYDIKDKQNPVLKRVIEQEGNYVSSRKIGSDIHIISSHYVYYPWQGVPFPRYKDSLAGEEYKTVEPGKIMIYPKYPSNSIVLISSTDIFKNKETKITSFVGNADNVYMTSDSMYLTYQEMPYYIMPFPMPIIDSSDDSVSSEDAQSIEDAMIAPEIWPPGRPGLPYNPKITTNIKKFAIKDESIVFKAQNKIQGNVLNQFSMDEHNGYFRVAYTRDNWNFENGSSITVFDKDMNRVGSIDGIAKGERIYSVRFMGDTAYMVTFKTIDPFFVMDMSVPSQPQMLGYLKIPGYSDYLHPFDENHIIGFGKDTMEMGGNAFQLGMKISLFDVTDFSNPVEKDVEIIGDRGTESELLYNHKALMYDKNRSLMGFPVTLARLPVNAKPDMHGFPPFGEQVFQGAYIYNISAENGIDLKGTISHIENFNPYNYLYNNEIRRVIYIGDTIYSISNNWIMATDINTMRNLSKVSIAVH